MYNNRYPTQVVFKFDGWDTPRTVGPSFNDFQVNYLSDPAPGRGQYGTEVPLGHIWQSPGITTGPSRVDADAYDRLTLTLVWDITILVHGAEKRITRFANGVQRLSVTTTLRHADIQLGDFVTVVSDIPLKKGKSGVDSSSVF